MIILETPLERPSLPVANYSAAIARAVDWLGDRYLLARPINVVPGHDAMAAKQLASHDRR